MKPFAPNSKREPKSSPRLFGAIYLRAAVWASGRWDTRMLQAASLAENEGATTELVIAALLHAVGHVTGPVTGAGLMAGSDNRHIDASRSWPARSATPRQTS